MKAKFWTGYLFAVLVMLGGVHFLTAQMPETPLTLSDSQMEELSGTRGGWNCVWATPCVAVSCTSNTHTKTSPGSSTCTTCETDINASCYSSSFDCTTCTVTVYRSGCSGASETYHEWVTSCN